MIELGQAPVNSAYIDTSIAVVSIMSRVVSNISIVIAIIIAALACFAAVRARWTLARRTTAAE